LLDNARFTAALFRLGLTMLKIFQQLAWGGHGRPNITVTWETG
jgi:hypothetical protein